MIILEDGTEGKEREKMRFQPPFRGSFFFPDFISVELDHAFGTEAVAEFCFRMHADVRFDLSPITVVVADFFAIRADGQETPERVDLLHRLLQLGAQFLPFDRIAYGAPQE